MGHKLYSSQNHGNVTTIPRHKHQWGQYPLLLWCPVPNKGVVTPAFLGIPKQRGTKSEVAASPAFSGAQKRAEMLRHPCILGDPQTKGDKIKSGCIGDKDKSLGMQPKRISPKKIRTNGVLALKNTLKTPPWAIFKQGGGVPKPLMVSDF